MSMPSKLIKPTRRTTSLVAIFGLVGLSLSLGCSVGALVVQVGTPTPTPPKTPQATFTITPIRTATFTPSPTWTATNTPLPTPTFTPSPTPVPQDTAQVKPVQEAPAPPPPAEPMVTPAPAEPAASPTSAFPFDVVFYQHDTGSPGETRITGWIRQDSGPGQYKTLSNFQIKAIAPDGNVYLSEPSGTGTADSTVAGTGDNHRMNTKLEIRPYTAGVYKIQLVEGGVPVSAEIEINMATEPRQYIHFDFFKPK